MSYYQCLQLRWWEQWGFDTFVDPLYLHLSGPRLTVDMSGTGTHTGSGIGGALRKGVGLVHVSSQNFFTL
jgi:hypothetical protein